MAITILRDLPPIVSTRNDTWMQLELNVGKKLIVKIIYDGTVMAMIKFPVDSLNRVSFNLKRFLEAMGDVSNIIGVHLPAFNQIGISTFNKNLKEFSVSFTEKGDNDETIADGELYSSCLLSGINPQNINGNTLMDFLSITPKRFLTNKPLKKLTSLTTQEYLYFYNRDPAFNENIAVKAKLNFSDGTSSGFLTIPLGASDFNFPATVIVPAGYSQMNLDGYVPDGKEVLSYDVFVSGTGRQTEVHSFEIDRRCYEFGRELIFLNSLGGMDTVRLANVEEISIRVEKEQVERYQGISTTFEEGQYYDFNVRTNREMKAVTMLLTNGERDWMQELFHSDRVFEINNGRFLPVRIMNNSISLRKGGVAYQLIQFDYRYRFDDIGYTRPF